MTATIQLLPEPHTHFVSSISPGGPALLALLLALVLAVALPAALVAARYRTVLIAVGLGAFALGGIAVLRFGPRDSLLRDPVLPNILVGIGLAVILGTGVLLGVLARKAWQRLRRGRNDIPHL